MVHIAMPQTRPIDLSLMVWGLVLGMILGPMVMGQLSPALYERLFIGTHIANDELGLFDQQTQERLARLTQTGVTRAAVQEQQQQIEQQRLTYEAGVERAADAYQHRLMGIMSSLIFAFILVLLVEVLMGPVLIATGRGVLAKLANVRSGLLAIWIVIALAQPKALGEVQLAFVVLLVAVGLAAATVPLGATKRPGQG